MNCLQLVAAGCWCLVVVVQYLFISVWLQIHRFVKFISRRLNYIGMINASGGQDGEYSRRTYTTSRCRCGLGSVNSAERKYLSHLSTYLHHFLCWFFFPTQTAWSNALKVEQKNHVKSYMGSVRGKCFLRGKCVCVCTCACARVCCSEKHHTFIRLYAISASSKCENKQAHKLKQ